MARACMAREESSQCIVPLWRCLEGEVTSVCSGYQASVHYSSLTAQ